MAEDMKMKRTVAKQQFTRAENSLRQTLNNPESLESTVKRKFAELGVKWQAVQDTHDAFMAMLSLDESEKEDSWIDELVARFDSIEVKTDQILVKFQEKKPLVEKTDDQMPGSSKKQDAGGPKLLQLERLKLDKFCGDLRKYPTFR